MNNHLFKTPILTTKRLILRPIDIADVKSYEKYFVTYDVISELGIHVPWPYPDGGVRKHLRTQVIPKQGHNLWTWAITLKDDPDELIGSIDLCKTGKPENRGFWLGRQFWGMGIMTEALVPITDYAFDILKFDRFIFTNALGNVRSRRIKEKTGAQLLHIEPAQFVNPNYKQREVWQLDKKQWDNIKSKL